MRAVILPLLLAAALLAVPAVLADDERGGDHRATGEAKATEARANKTADHDDNDTDDGANESKGGHGRNASFNENRTALFDRVIAQMHALRTSWHENATKVREGCHATDFDRENATKENRTANAHCIRDGYKAWRASHSADIKELREELRALLDARRGEHKGADA